MSQLGRAMSIIEGEITTDLHGVRVGRKAIFSDDRKHRLLLMELWGPELPLGFNMLNPSDAGAVDNDPTWTRCKGFARRENAGGLMIGNLFTLISKDPRALLSEPVLNDSTADLWILQVAVACSRVVLAWGVLKTVQQEARAQDVFAVMDRVGAARFCLGFTKDRYPKHPLYLHRDTPIEEWEPNERQDNSYCVAAPAWRSSSRAGRGGC